MTQLDTLSQASDGALQALLANDPSKLVVLKEALEKWRSTQAPKQPVPALSSNKP